MDSSVHVRITGHLVLLLVQCSRHPHNIFLHDRWPSCRRPHIQLILLVNGSTALRCTNALRFNRSQHRVNSAFYRRRSRIFKVAIEEDFEFLWLFVPLDSSEEFTLA